MWRQAAAYHQKLVVRSQTHPHRWDNAELLQQARRIPVAPCLFSQLSVSQLCCDTGVEEGSSNDEISSTESRSPKRLRSCMFCSSVWSTPEQMIFQGHPSGMCSSIPPIKVASVRESFSRCSVGKRRPTIKPPIKPPSRIAIRNNILFIVPPPCHCTDVRIVHASPIISPTYLSGFVYCLQWNSKHKSLSYVDREWPDCLWGKEGDDAATRLRQ